MSFWENLFGTSKSVEESKPTQKNTNIKTIIIGDQIWTAENLDVDHYRNGDPIPEVKDPEEWSKLKTGAWCYYDNDPENGKKYGKLYNWYAVNNPRGLAPKGWHIPTKEEFDKLRKTIEEDANSLKAVGQGINEGAGTNTSGFSALLADYRSGNGAFYGLGYSTDFWSSTEYDADYAYFMYLNYYDSNIYYGNDPNKGNGFSVRCVKDNDNLKLHEDSKPAPYKPIFKEVKIGDQIWMTENLNVDHYRNGDPIPELKDPEEWSKLKTGAWCYYNNDPDNGRKYGKLYNWYAVNDPRGLAPEGWHVLESAGFLKIDMAVLLNGNALKAVGQGTGAGAGTNTSGFSALLSGYRSSNGLFDGLKSYATFWSSTGLHSGHAFYKFLYYSDTNFNLSGRSKEFGFSVRCVKD